MTKQIPIGSGYGNRTNAAEILAGVDLRGKVAIITGAILAWAWPPRRPCPRRVPRWL